MKSLLSLVLAFLFSISVQQAFAFSDLPETHHHYHPMMYLEYEGVIQGYSDGTVRPGNEINRAELIKILVEGLGHSTNASIHRNCFPDVTTEWFAPYICYAQQQGWVGGYPDGTFRPAQTVNKVEALKIILNAFGITPSSAPTTVFSDTSIDDWYSGYLQVAADKNLLEEGRGTAFRGWNTRNRGEVSEMVARIMQLQLIGDQVYSTQLRAEFQNFLYLHQLRLAEGITTKLKLNPTLTIVAREHAKDMGDVIGGLSHTSSDGVTQSYDRIKAIMKAQDDPNFNGRTGENVGGGSVNPSNPFATIKWVHDNIFMPEDPTQCNHRTTLLSQCLPFTEVGIGVYVNAGGQVYFTNDFITRGQADTMEMRAGLEIPADYSSNPSYTIVDSADNYVTTLVNNCSGAKVRLEYFIELGVFDNNGSCMVYEHAWSNQPQWNTFRDYLNNQFFDIELTSTYYTPEPPSQQETFVAVTPGRTAGWELVNHENPNIPMYFDVGTVGTLSIKNSLSGEVLTFQLDFTQQGYVLVRQL